MNKKIITVNDGNNPSNAPWATWHGARCGTSPIPIKKVVEGSLRMESRRSAHKQTSVKRTQRNQLYKVRFVMGWGKLFASLYIFLKFSHPIAIFLFPCSCPFVHAPGLFLWCCMTRIATIEAALDADQLQAWQAFYDGVSGMSSCSKCNKRNDPCSCGWGSYPWAGVLCEGDSITKMSLYSCSLSGKSAYSFPWLCAFHHDLLYCRYCVVTV